MIDSDKQTLLRIASKIREQMKLPTKAPFPHAIIALIGDEAESVARILCEVAEGSSTAKAAKQSDIGATGLSFDSEGIPYAAADDPRIEPLKVAIEGECDGLMIANESARTILGQMDHEMILSGAVPAERFFLSTDNDSHWYLVPAAKAAEWEEWIAIPEDDERAWDAPEFAKPLGGAPGLVTFVDPQQGGTTVPQSGED